MVNVLEMRLYSKQALYRRAYVIPSRGGLDFTLVLKVSQGTTVYASLTPAHAIGSSPPQVSIPGQCNIPVSCHERARLSSSTIDGSWLSCQLRLLAWLGHWVGTDGRTPELRDPSSHTSTCSVDHRSPGYYAASRDSFSAHAPIAFGIHRYLDVYALFLYGNRQLTMMLQCAAPSADAQHSAVHVNKGQSDSPAHTDVRERHASCMHVA
jgi:hypothetical protein